MKKTLVPPLVIVFLILGFFMIVLPFFGLIENEFIAYLSFFAGTIILYSSIMSVTLSHYPLASLVASSIIATAGGLIVVSGSIYAILFGADSENLFIIILGALLLVMGLVTAIISYYQRKLKSSE